MKVYTKTGDSGETGLLGNIRVSKSSNQIDVYGECDELNSFLGLLKVSVDEKLFVEKIQKRLFDLGSNLATLPQDREKYNLYSINLDDVQSLENEIDRMESEMEPIKNFILPGGSESSCYAHICRSVSRRFERKLVSLKLNEDNMVESNWVKYINRLSDYLFVLARYLNFKKGVKEDFWSL